MKEALEKYISNKETEKIIHYYSNQKLEQLSNTFSITLKVYDYLESLKDYESLIKIMKSISNYKINVLADELKEAYKILLKSKKCLECLEFLKNHYLKNKKFDDTYITDIIRIILNRVNETNKTKKLENLNDINFYTSDEPQENQFNINEICESVILEDDSRIVFENSLTKENQILIQNLIDFLQIYSLNTINFNNNIWSFAIEESFKLKNYYTGFKIIEVMPFKSNYSDFVFKKCLKEYSHYFMYFWSILKEKYQMRCSQNNNYINNDEVKCYESCFNVIIQYLPDAIKSTKNDIYNVDLEKSKLILLQITKYQNINIKEKTLEDFLIFVTNDEAYTDQTLCFFIIISNSFLTSRIINKVINSLYDRHLNYLKQNNEYDLNNEYIKCIFLIISLCKSKKINVSYENITLETNVLKDLFSYASKYISIDLDHKSISSLNEDNFSFAKSYFTHELGNIKDGKFSCGDSSYIICLKDGRKIQDKFIGLLENNNEEKGNLSFSLLGNSH